MSPDNVESHRALYRAMNDPDLETMVELCDADIEVQSASATVGGGIYHGPDGVRRWVQDMYETWGPEFLADPQTFFDLGETTLVDALIHGRGAQSGLQTAMPVVAVARWRDGRCTHHKAHTDRESALREAQAGEAALNAEVVRRILEPRQRGDEATVFALYDEAVEWDVSRTAGPAAGREPVLRGHEGVRQWFRSWYEGFHDVRYELLDVVATAAHVVTHVLQRGRGRTSGAEVLLDLHGVWTVADGKVTSVVWFPEHQDAMGHARATGPTAAGR